MISAAAALQFGLSNIYQAVRGVGLGVGAVGAGVGSKLPLASLEIASQRLWNLQPVLLPDINSIITAWQRGFLGPDEGVSYFCGLQGVAWFPQGGKRNPAYDSYYEAWKGVSELLLLRPDINQILQALAMGFIKPTELDRLLHHLGVDRNDFGLLKDFYRTFPSLGLLFEARNRGLIDNHQEYLEYLNRLGYGKKEQEILSTLRYAIPSPQDLIRFQVREAFEPALAGPLGYYDEAPAPVYKWMEQQGYGWGPDIQIVSDGVQRDATWTDLWWAAHWQTLSPGQTYEMMHRLRPDRIQRFVNLGFNVNAFTIDDVRRHLRIADYPKSVRDYLAAMSSSVLDMRIVRQKIKLAAEGVLPDPDIHDWAIAQFLDRGLLPDDAEVQYQVTVGMVEREKFAGLRRFENEGITKIIQEILLSYEHGFIERIDATNRLIQIGTTPEAANIHLDAIDAKVERELANEAINATQRDYMTGTINRGEALAELGSMGITLSRANQYITYWSLRRDRAHRQVAAGQIVRAIGEGMIDIPTAAGHLENLGYRGFDEQLQIAEGQKRLKDLLERQQRAAEAEIRKRLKELEQIRKEAESLQRRTEADIRRSSPIGTVKKWWMKGQVDDAFVSDRLSAGAYTAADITEYLDQWRAEKTAKGL